MAWETPLNLLRRELCQRADEGCNVPADLTERCGALDGEADAFSPLVEELYTELMALPDDPELARREPNDLAAIRRLRPAGPRELGFAPSEEEALDRFHGAWTGRAVGCALGKPVELLGLACDERGRSLGRSNIKRYLERRGDWPLADYFSGRSLGDGLELWCPASQREQIAFMEPDDDIHYTLVALGCLEEHGPGFGWEDVARYWLAHLPLYSICTAEAQAIETFSRLSTRPGNWRSAVTSELTRRHRNPYREWIGAQIRADGWAYAAAGKPELAAELAHRDASFTHERNGIYGAMMFAAIIAAAFVERDPKRLVEIGLSEIPEHCRLARAVRDCLGWLSTEPDFEACASRIERAHEGVHPVHTIPNALICVSALVLGEMHPTKTVTTAVMCGQDTDCNGATVGSVVGAARGRSSFGEELAGRLRDTIRPSVAGFEQVTMRCLAERTWQQYQRVDAYHRGRAQ